MLFKDKKGDWKMIMGAVLMVVIIVIALALITRSGKPNVEKIIDATKDTCTTSGTGECLTPTSDGKCPDGRTKNAAATCPKQNDISTVCCFK